jgi:hypothetical protein
MISRILTSVRRRQSAQAGDSLNGEMPSVLRFTSRRIVSLAIPDPSRLPIPRETLSSLQTTEGANVFISGYSVGGGLDVISAPEP